MFIIDNEEFKIINKITIYRNLQLNCENQS